MLNRQMSINPHNLIPFPMMNLVAGKAPEGIQKPNEIKYVSIKQLNLQKHKLATDNLSKCMVKWSSSPLFVFLQEPWTHKGRIAGFPRKTQIFARAKPRAAILASPDMKVWAIDEFSTPDVMTCLWKTDNEECPEIIIVSVYSDIN